MEVPHPTPDLQAPRVEQVKVDKNRQVLTPQTPKIITTQVYSFDGNNAIIYGGNGNHF
jgi:hypothetical protein